MFKRESREFLSKYLIVFLRPFLSLFHSRKLSIVYFLFFSVFFMVSSFFFIVYSVNDLKELPSILQMEKPSILYGINKEGKNEPIAEFYRISRNNIMLEDLSKEENESANKVLQSFITSEDRNFYDHFGVDFKGILRAFLINLAAGRIKEGASTITQQVARLKFLSRERSYVRKIREIWLSFLLESYYSKETILQVYLNEVPLGHGNIGVAASAKFYFRKDIDDLTWAEAALLASLTTRPAQLSPLVYPQRSRNKVKVTLNKLVENGNIDVKTAEKTFSELTQFYYNLNRSPNESAFSDRLNRFPYFTEYIRKRIRNYIPSYQLYNGGFKIYSTLNIAHQVAAEKALKQGLKSQNNLSSSKHFKNIDIFDQEYGDIYPLISSLSNIADFQSKVSKKARDFNRDYEESIKDSLFLSTFFNGLNEVDELIKENTLNQEVDSIFSPVEGALISLRPHTGEITSLVGGSGFRPGNQQIRAFQAYRQPGSSFKPFIFATALDLSISERDLNYSISPASLFFDSPLLFIVDNGIEWKPSNYGVGYNGFVTFRTALKKSINTVSVKILHDIGLKKTVPKLEKLFNLSKSRRIPYNYSLALGTFEISPFEAVSAYNVFASNGKYVEPMSIYFIEDDKGEKVKDFQIEKKKHHQVFSSETSIIMTSILGDALKSGTGKKVFQNGEIKHPVVGKTGTTNQYKDAWFSGYSPNLVATVWVGYDSNLSLGSGMSGGVVAAPIWGDFMREALENEVIKPFETKSNKIIRRKICKISGKIPDGSRCTEIEEEYFTAEIYPTEICRSHRGYRTNLTQNLGLFGKNDDMIR